MEIYIFHMWLLDHIFGGFWLPKCSEMAPKLGQKWNQKSIKKIAHSKGVSGLIFLEIIFASAPASQVRGSKDQSKCLYKDDVTENSQRITGWLYMVVFPYYLPLGISIFPIFRITNRLRRGSEAMTERSKVQNYIVLSICGGYFFFHLLYYLLMFGREVEFVAFEVSNFRMMLRRPIWFITRPMFSLIGYGWHIIVPLTPFVFDPDLYECFPGKYVNRVRYYIFNAKLYFRHSIKQVYWYKICNYSLTLECYYSFLYSETIGDQEKRPKE